MRRLLVAEPALVPRLARLLLVAEPLQVLGRDTHPWRFRRGGWWMWGFGGHVAIVSVLDGRFRLRATYILDDDEFWRHRRRLFGECARTSRAQFGGY
jgi:hypothetical protein